jgi:hypothetical protein
MRQAAFAIQGFAALLLATAAAAQGAKPLAKCAPDAVLSGSVCIDEYEASVWRVTDPDGLGLALVAKIRQGKVTHEDLLAGGARLLGSVDDYSPCLDNGTGCSGDNGNVFAVSLKNVPPSRHITWFQAQQACKSSRKRLPTSAEWQQAVAGTQDPGGDDEATSCNTASTQQVAVPTGSREACVSADGAFDMVGNVAEWVADSMPLSVDPIQTQTPCGEWSTGDEQCLNGINDTSGGAGVLLRGGSATSGTAAGPLAIRDAEPGVPTTTTTTAPPTTTTTTTTTTDTSATTTTTTTTTTTVEPTTTTLPPLVHVGFRCVR